MKNLLLSTMALTFSVQAFSQGAFQNLSFEAAFGLPSSGNPQYVSTTNALPGWNVSDAGGNPDPQVGYNGVSVGGALVTLVGTTPVSGAPALDGNYTVVLASGETGTGFAPVSIYQTGTIPGSAKSILFIANYNVSSLSVQFDSHFVPFILLSSSPGYQTYGGDISAFAGQTGELRFTENVAPPNPEPIAYLDDIQFSVLAIPEPSTWALLALGGGALLLRRKKLHKGVSH